MSTSGNRLKDFVKRFNTDDEFRESFLNDPVGNMERLGWTIPPDQKQDLIDIARDIASQIRDSANYKWRIDITDTAVIVRPGVRI
jgi:hypothetical protein